MPGFANLDAIINAVSVNLKLQRLQYNKVLPSTSVIYIPHTFWLATGNPAAGTTPDVGLAGAVKCDMTTQGAILYTNPTGPATMHILSMMLYSVTPGIFYLVDRLAHANVAVNQADGSFSPIIDGRDRLDSGEGGQIIMEVTGGTLSIAANTVNLTYTNESDVSHITPLLTTVASSKIGRVPYANYIWVPLLAGDKGVRTITYWDITADTQTGNINIVIVKPIAQLIVPGASIAAERDFVVELPCVPKIKDNSCLMLYFVPQAASSAICIGEIRICEN
jgi:hypothetical protein